MPSFELSSEMNAIGAPLPTQIWKRRAKKWSKTDLEIFDQNRLAWQRQEGTALKSSRKVKVNHSISIAAIVAHTAYDR